MQFSRLSIFLLAFLAIYTITANGQTDDLLITNLPIVLINTNGQTIPDDPKITAQMGIIYNGPGEMNAQNDPLNNYNGKIGIEVRGQSTQSFPKKCYGFETREESGANLNVSLLGMPEENDWILYATYTDKSMLRNALTFTLGKSLGQYCSRMAFCELILNGQYMGVYILMEKIKKDENRVNIATLNPDEIAGDNLTGGYIVKVDKITPGFQYGADGWLSNPSPSYPNAMDITFQYYYPEPADLVIQQRNYIKNYISTAEKKLIATTFKDPDSGYNQYFDVASFIDFMIISELSKEVDKYRYSTFFYKEKDSNGGKLSAGPIWDFDLGYSNVDYWPPGIEFTGWLYNMVEPVSWGIMYWWKRLMEDPYYQNLLKTRWVNLRLNELSNTRIGNDIDSITSYINEAQQRNYQRWPILGVYVWPNYDWQGNSYQAEVAFFENWLTRRLTWLDYNIPGNVIRPWAEITGDESEIHLKLHEDYFSRFIFKKKYFKLNNAPPGIKVDTVICQNATTATIKLNGNISGNTELSVTIDRKAVNTFKDITTNTLGTSGIIPFEEIQPEIKIFTVNQVLEIKTAQPQLLDETVRIFDIMGRQAEVYRISQQNENSITLNLIPGVYLVQLVFDSKPQIQRIIIGR